MLDAKCGRNGNADFVLFFFCGKFVQILNLILSSHTDLMTTKSRAMIYDGQRLNVLRRSQFCALVMCAE